jgi:hypothetical protein
MEGDSRVEEVTGVYINKNPSDTEDAALENAKNTKTEVVEGKEEEGGGVFVEIDKAKFAEFSVEFVIESTKFAFSGKWHGCKIQYQTHYKLTSVMVTQESDGTKCTIEKTNSNSCSYFTAELMGKHLSNTLSGWVYPHGGKSLTESNQRIVLRKQPNFKAAHLKAPHAQLEEILKKNHAHDVSTPATSILSCVYKALLNMRDECRLVQQVVVSVSGVDFKPAKYSVRDYAAPTQLYNQLYHESEQAIKTRGSYLYSGSDVGRTFSAFTIQKYMTTSSRASIVGSLLHSQGLVYLSSADSGLKFKDRQATKLAMARREEMMATIISDYAG